MHWHLTLVKLLSIRSNTSSIKSIFTLSQACIPLRFTHFGFRRCINHVSCQITYTQCKLTHTPERLVRVWMCKNINCRNQIACMWIINEWCCLVHGACGVTGDIGAWKPNHAIGYHYVFYISANYEHDTLHVHIDYVPILKPKYCITWGLNIRNNGQIYYGQIVQWVQLTDAYLLI